MNSLKCVKLARLHIRREFHGHIRNERSIDDYLALGCIIPGSLGWAYGFVVESQKSLQKTRNYSKTCDRIIPTLMDGVFRGSAYGAYCGFWFITLPLELYDHFRDKK